MPPLAARSGTSSRSSWLCAAAGTVLLAVGGPSVAGQPGVTVNVGQIDDIVTSMLVSGEIPGASVAIERHGQVIYQKGFGFSDVENKVRVTPDTVFPIGSITKTMTGLAINQLIAAGKVDLDAPVGRYVPDLPEPARSAKLRFLLDHVSGLINYTEVPGFPNDSQAPITRQGVVQWFDSRPLLFAPGSRWSYTNSGFYLLGLVIEAVSGETYADYLRQHEFEPFGMTHTSLTSWEPILPNRAHGYRRGTTGLENAPRYDPLYPFAAGAVLSTSGDLLKYRRGVFGDGPTPQKLRAQLLLRDSLPDGLLLPYSLGSLVFTEFEGHRRIGHPGDISGFSAQYSYYPDDDLTIVILTNTQHARFPPMSIEQKIARALFGVPPPTIADASLPNTVAERLVGEYQVGDLRFGFDRIAFAVKNGVLQLAIGGEGAPSVALRYQGGTRFVSSVDDEQWIEFARSADSTQVSVAFYGSPLVLHRIVTEGH
jgi:CubicO group peptidase (beta-lactamase class C family)